MPMQILRNQITHQAVHRSRGHNLQQRIGCCWETWVQSRVKRINTFIKLKLFMKRYKICKIGEKHRQSAKLP